MKPFLLLISAIFVLASPVFACEPCALSNASRLQGHSAEAFTLSVSEQYTEFDRASDFNDNSLRDGELVRGYSTTQFALSYDISEQFGLQATLPLIARRFDQLKQFRSSDESDVGFGDASLIGSYSFVNHTSTDWAVTAGLAAGLKFPTGDTGILKKVSVEEKLVDHLLFKHHQIGSGSGGRALTFGSGSYDYIFGLNLLSRYQRYVALTSAQYTLRTEGDFDYEFADDFLWSVGSGYYFFFGHEYSTAALVVLSGESKSKDHLNNELVGGSQASNLYLGPELLFTLSEKVGAEVGVDFRITREDQGATVVPESRVRASFSYRFS